MNLVIDYMLRHDVEWLKKARARGITGVVRYIDPYNPKGVTPPEAQDILGLGLDLHLVFEIGGAGPFTEDEGRADYLLSIPIVEKLGAPKHTRVYFAADTNISPEVFTPYANGIESVQTDDIDPGIYGYQRLCEFAFSQFPNMGKRLWQTYGTVTVPLDLWQHEQQTWDGVDVDLNEAHVRGWHAPSGVPTGTLEEMTDDEFKAAYLRVIAPDLEAEIQQRARDSVSEALKEAAAKLAQ